MTNSNDHTVHELPAGAPQASPSPLPLPLKDDREARDRWRRIGLRLGEIAEAEVEKLRNDQDTEKPKTDVNPTIRAIAQVVITSLRAMEMEDNYDRKLGSEQSPDSYAERKRKADERARRIKRELERQAAARGERAPGDAKDRAE